MKSVFKRYLLQRSLLGLTVLALTLTQAPSYAAHKKHHRASSKAHHSISASKNYRVSNVDTAQNSFRELYQNNGEPVLASTKAIVLDQHTGEVIYGKNVDAQTPIASVTKLMTAMVVLDAQLPLDEILTVTDDDVDRLKGSSSKLPVGTELTRGELMHLALMASENRAAAALGRNYPGGMPAFIAAMNAKAKQLGMMNSQFVDPTGLNSGNVSTASDLARMVNAAYQYPQIRQVSTTASQEFPVSRARHPVNFSNTNMLVRNSSERWDIGLSKTGYISEAGRCLVMQAKISGKDVVLVFLNSVGKLSRIGDAERIRKWLEKNQPSS
jgi:D-alanyl-D-alanine endopeptidase (penicillin-binding protein 7)